MLSPSQAQIAQVALLAALPFAAILYVRFGQTEALRRSPGRWFLSYALFFAVLLNLLRFTGAPALLAVLGLLLGFMGSRRGVGAVYGGLYGPRALEAHPHLVARDADRLHLFMMIAAVLCFAAGLVFATLPGLR